MKKLEILFFLTIATFSYSQVGINTPSPKATLDIIAQPAGTAADGIIAPRISGDNLRTKSPVYTAADHTGAIVYVTQADSAPAGKTVNVTSAGYYYFDGTVWVLFNTVSNNPLEGSSVVKMRLTNSSSANVLTTKSGTYSFRYNGTGINNWWEMKSNTGSNRPISVFVSENWAPSSQSSSVSPNNSNATTAWSRIPGSTIVGATNELNVFRIYDLTDGKEIILEGNLIDVGGTIKQAMIATEY